MKIYKYVYDKDADDDGQKKPNELLGEFEIVGDMSDYSYDVIGYKDGKVFNINGKEVSFLRDPYHAGTRNFVEINKPCTTQLADIDRLLDRLEPFWAVWNEATDKQRELIGDSIKLAHQTYEELRDKYQTEEKDER